MINTVPMVIALAVGLHNPFAFLDVFDSFNNCAKGGKNYSPYISIVFLPLVKNLEYALDVHVIVWYMTVSYDIFIFHYCISTYYHLLHYYATGKET